MKKVNVIAFAIALMAVPFVAFAQQAYVIPVNDADVQGRILLANAKNQSVAKFRFSATELGKIRALRFFVTDNGNAIFTENVDSMRLLVGNSIVGTKRKVISGTSIVFQDMGITIPEDGSVLISVQVDLKKISKGAITGSRFKIVLAADYSTDSSVAIEFPNSHVFAYGTQVLNVNTTLGSSVYGNIMILYKTKIYNSGTSAFVKTASFKVSTIIAGLNPSAEIGQGVKIYKWAYKADAAGDAAWKQCSFEILGSNTAFNMVIYNYQIYEVSGATDELIAGTFSDGTNGTSNSAELSGGTTIRFTATNERFLAAGSVNVYELRGDVFGSLAGYSLSVSPRINDTYVASQVFSGIMGNFVWSDYSVFNHSVSTADWNNSFKMESFDYEFTTPVELVSFEAIPNGKGDVELTWATATETNNYGFEIEKSYDGSTFKKVGFVPGKGTTTERQEYSFVDGIKAAEAYYRLKQVDMNGRFEYRPAILVLSQKEGSFELSQNYPNPFNPATQIKFFIPKQGMASLKLYDPLGREVMTLASGVLAAGEHAVSFNGTGLASGVYFYKLTSGNFSQVKKMTLSK